MGKLRLYLLGELNWGVHISGLALNYNDLSIRLKSDYFLNVANLSIKHQLTCGLIQTYNFYLKHLSVQ
jgi:hypothetical protein